MKLKSKTMATLLIAIFMISTFAFAVALPVDFPSEYGIWQPDSDSGTVECTDAQFKNGAYSAYLQVNFPSNPPATYGYTSDSNEVYVHTIFGTGDGQIDTLDDLDSMSFWYYRVPGGDEIPPQIDVWLSTDGTYTRGPVPTGDEEWLLGQIPVATGSGGWVFVSHSSITWIKAMGGDVYGMGSTGLANAKAGVNGPALGGSYVLAIGIQVGSSATRDNLRTTEGKYYIDDMKINGAVYGFEFTSTTALETTVGLPTVSISVDPTSINYGPLTRGETSTTHVITVDNIGDVPVDISTTVIEDEAFYASYLTLGGSSIGTWTATNLAPSDTPLAIGSVLTLPNDFAFAGDYTGTLVFWAEETP